MKMTIFLIIISLFINGASGQSGVVRVEPEVITYRKIDTISLDLRIYKPMDFNIDKNYKTVVFFHGGGWNNGKPEAFKRQSMYFASRGMIAITPEYRLREKHGITPFECVEDAFDVMDFVKKNAENLNIDPSWIAVGGGSAGGHLALTTGFWKVEEPLARAMLLFNPVIDTGPSGYGFQRLGDRFLEISPIDKISEQHPPALILIGTEDKIIPVEAVNNYKKKVEEQGGRCDVVFYEGQGHAFFAKKPIKYFIETTHEADRFLVSLGFLEGESTIHEQYKNATEK